MVVMKLTEERPLDLAFRRILLILVKAVLAKKLGGRQNPDYSGSRSFIYFFKVGDT